MIFLFLPEIFEDANVGHPHFQSSRHFVVIV